jgi:hypothetical protein
VRPDGLHIDSHRDCIRAPGLKHVLCSSWGDDNLGEWCHQGCRTFHCFFWGGSVCSDMLRNGEESLLIRLVFQLGE